MTETHPREKSVRVRFTEEDLPALNAICDLREEIAGTLRFNLANMLGAGIATGQIDGTDHMMVAGVIRATTREEYDEAVGASTGPTGIQALKDAPDAQHPGERPDRAAGGRPGDRRGHPRRLELGDTMSDEAIREMRDAEEANAASLRKEGLLDDISLVDIAWAFEWSFDNDFLACDEELIARDKFHAILCKALGEEDVVPGDGLMDRVEKLVFGGPKRAVVEAMLEIARQERQAAAGAPNRPRTTNDPSQPSRGAQRRTER